jgi:GNAT superfamily N-acetyltransferase
MAITPERLLPFIPDEPGWIDTRGLLRGGRCRIVGSDTDESGRPDCFAISEEFPFAGVVGRPPRESVLALVASSPRIELLAQEESREWIASLLPDWTVEPAHIHTLSPEVEAAIASTAPVSGDGRRGAYLWPAGSDPPIDHLHAELRDEVRTVVRRSPVASWLEEGRPVAICLAAVETERYWDVSVETLEPYRGRGLAGTCFGLLAARMVKRGRRAVWGAHASNRASLRAAAKLGFDEVARFSTFRAPARPGPEGTW